MSIIAWVVLGGLAGWVGSLLTRTDAAQGILLNIVIGIVGAVLGGYLFNTFGAAGVTDFNIYSFVVAVIGSVIAIWAVQRVRQTR